MKRAEIVFTPEFLCESMGLPDGTVILGAQFDGLAQYLRLIVMHPDLPNVSELEPSPRAQVVTQSDGAGVEWSVRRHD